MTRSVAAAWLWTCFCASACAANLPSNSTPSWNPSAAAHYLDQRETWWMNWPPVAREHRTFCVSCHTAMPYALARPALGRAPEAERQLRENIVKRVRLWNEIQPYYPDQARQSRGTEAVLNALALSSMDARRGKLSEDARAAFDHLWKLQDPSGAWPWINFGNEPWEGPDSAFYGATLAAIAVGVAPDHYQFTPAIQSNVALFRSYLRTNYSKQPLIHQAFLLWASAKLTGLLSLDQQARIVEDLSAEQRSDGGWSLSSLAWSWRGSAARSILKLWLKSDESPWKAQSDGLATGLAVFALEQFGLPPQDPRLQRGLAWLKRNQKSDGSWRARSLSTHRDFVPGPGMFMSDAATAFAVLALSSAR